MDQPFDGPRTPPGGTSWVRAAGQQTLAIPVVGWIGGTTGFIAPIIGVVSFLVVGGVSVSILVMSLMVPFTAWGLQRCVFRYRAVQIDAVPENLKETASFSVRALNMLSIGLRVGLPSIFAILICASIAWARLPGYMTSRAESLYENEASGRSPHVVVDYISTAPKQIIQFPKQETVVVTETPQSITTGTSIKAIPFSYTMSMVIGDASTIFGTIGLWLLIFVFNIFGLMVVGDVVCMSRYASPEPIRDTQ